MIFTKEMIEEIRARLSNLGIKDTEIPRLNQTSSPLTGNETFILVKDGVNVRVTLNDIYEHFPELADIIIEGGGNVSMDYFNASAYSEKMGGSLELTLEEAIELVPETTKKVGLYVTFYTSSGTWETYQMVGESIEDDWNVNHFTSYYKELQEQIDYIKNSEATVTWRVSPRDFFDAENLIQAQLTFECSVSASKLEIKRGIVTLSSGNNTDHISVNVSLTQTETYIGLATIGSILKSAPVKVYVIHKIKYCAGQSYNESSANTKLAKTPDGTYEITIPSGGGYIYFYIPTDLPLKDNYELSVALKEETPSPIDMEIDSEHSDDNGILWKSVGTYDPGTYQFTVKIN